MKISKETYNRLINNSINVKQNKYHNKKIEYNGIKFDSKKEMSFYIKLKLMEQAGEIHELQMQKEFVIIKPFILNKKKYRKTSYFADFVYLDKENKLHVIDIKSKATRTPLYQLKKKLLAKEYSIEIEEI